MKLSVINLFLALVASLFMISGAIRYFKREERQTFFKLAAYLVVWGSILTFGLFPPVTRAISHRLGFGENLNTLIFFGFVVVFVALFKLVTAVERLERSVSEIVRREALEKLERILESRPLPRQNAGGPPPPPGRS